MLVAREDEIKNLEKLYNSDKSELVAIYGRRRVGKTFLVRELFKNRLTFDHFGMKSSNMGSQLQNFMSSVMEYNISFQTYPKTWLEAFNYIKLIVNNSAAKKKVVFLDEISWMDTKGSGFISALEAFWNNWCAKRDDILLILCSSVSKYIVDKIIYNTDGLYNRLSLEILLEPFTLKEVQSYLVSKDIILDKKSITELYMCLGGVPYYYSFFEKGESSSQYINRLFFAKNPKIKNEFEHLFQSQFENYIDYKKIIEVLSGRKNGYTRDEIKKALKDFGGELTKYLSVLEKCGYIRAYKKMGNKKKETLYQLIDNFILFHNKFLVNKSSDHNFWINNLNRPSVSSWQGLAFEIVALQHVDQIKEKLGIRGVYTECYSYFVSNEDAYTDKGCQIDLLIDRADNIIDICEIKFSKGNYSINGDDYWNMVNKIENFTSLSNTKKAINMLLITTYGLNVNQYSSYINYVITLEDLFSR